MFRAAAASRLDNIEPKSRIKLEAKFRRGYVTMEGEKGRFQPSNDERVGVKKGGGGIAERLQNTQRGCGAGRTCDYDIFKRRKVRSVDVGTSDTLPGD